MLVSVCMCVCAVCVCVKSHGDSVQVQDSELGWREMLKEDEE